MKIRKYRGGRSLIIRDRSAGRVKRGLKLYTPPNYHRRRAVSILALGAFGVIAALFIIWGVASVVTDILYTPEEKTESPILDVDEEAANFSDRDAADVLFVKLSDDGSEAEHLVLARFEPSEERVYVAWLHPQLTLDDKSLAEHYRAGGMTEMCASVAEAAGCEQVFSIGFNFIQTRQMINELGGVTFYCPQTVNYTAEQADRNVNIAKGKREYTGGEVARLLNFPDWEGGDAQHREMYRTVFSALIDQQIRKGRVSKFKDIYLKLYAGTRMDMPATDFHDRLGGLEYLAEHNDEDGSLTMEIDLPAVSNGDGVLVLSKKGSERMTALFGDRDGE